MERFVKGDILVLPFPFSDLSSSKKRPGLVVADLAGDDLILCQITSEHRDDGYAVVLKSEDFVKGSLNVESRIRTNRLFTADKSIILYKVGSLQNKKVKQVEDILLKIFKSN